MADLIGDAQTFIDRVRGLLESDDAVPETWNPVFQALINNDTFMKALIDAHKADTMPHQFVDGLTTYRYGLKLNATSDGLVFVYEEVI